MSEAFEKAWLEYRPDFADIEAYRLPDGILGFMDDRTMEFIVKTADGGFGWASLQKSGAAKGEVPLEVYVEELLRDSKAQKGQPLKEIYAGMGEWGGTQ